MEEILKSNTIFNIRKRFILLYLLNFTDAVFTRSLLATGVFLEINPFMKNIASSNFRIIIFKILFPLILLSIAYKRMKKASNSMLLISNRILLPVIIFYLLINILHIIGIILYLAFPWLV